MRQIFLNFHLELVRILSSRLSISHSRPISHLHRYELLLHPFLSVRFLITFLLLFFLLFFGAISERFHFIFTILSSFDGGLEPLLKIAEKVGDVVPLLVNTLLEVDGGF